MNAAFSYPRKVAGEVMTVTPELAQRWLNDSDLTHGNRRIRRTRVEQLARDMKAGRWRLNGESIILDRDGVLLDGHHRCRAIVLSGVAIESVVVINVDREPAAYTIDTGVARDAVDAVAFTHSVLKDAGIPLVRIKSIASFCVTIAARNNPRTPMTATDLEGWFAVYGPSLRAVWPHIGKAPASRAEVAAALVVLHKHNHGRVVESDILDFCSDLASGAMLEPSDPVHRTREKLQGKKPSSYRDRTVAASTVVRAFEARRRNKPWTRNAPSGEDPAGDLLELMPPAWVREVRAVRGIVRSAHPRPA